MAAELSRRGWLLATVTVKNAPGTDVLAQHPDTKRTVAIQTKTSSDGIKFTLGERDERTYPRDPGWVVLVGLAGELERPSFFVVPRCHLAAMLYAQHRWWLAEPGKRGQPHTDNPRRGVAREEVGASRVRGSRVTWSDGTCSRGNLGACRTSANPGTWNCSKPSDCVPSTSRVRCAHARNANWTLYPTLRSVSGQNAPRCLSRCPLGERGRWRPLSVTVCPVCL